MKLTMDSMKNRRYNFVTEHNEKKKSTGPKLTCVCPATDLTVNQKLLTHPVNTLPCPLSLLTATDSFGTEPTSPWPRKACNESRLQWEVEVCGEDFKRDMAQIDPQNWCNLTHFIRYEKMWKFMTCSRNVGSFF